MDATVNPQLFSHRVPRLAVLTVAGGVGGMAVSFYFLASAHPLDVLAGTAGFVAGAILVAGGVISLALIARPLGERTDLFGPLPIMNVSRWRTHFKKNRERRPEPKWDAPVTLPEAVVQRLVKSLEQFQLGDGGGPACLIAWDRERFLSSAEGTRELVDLWFAEEREHSRLLCAAVARFGGRPISSHWSFTAFCLTRKCLGVRFELTVLLLTELVSTVYYRLLRRHGRDNALRSMCRLIMRDEAGHVAFHRDRLARAGRLERARYGFLWEARFRALGLVAASVLWASHARALEALGATAAEFYGEVWLELSRFAWRLRRESAVPAITLELPSIVHS